MQVLFGLFLMCFISILVSCGDGLVGSTTLNQGSCRPTTKPLSLSSEMLYQQSVDNFLQDPFVLYQQHLWAIRFFEAEELFYNVTYGINQQIAVAVLDSTSRTSHGELVSKVSTVSGLTGITPLSPASQGTTHLNSLILAKKNNVGGVGVAYKNLRITEYPIRVAETDTQPHRQPDINKMNTSIDHILRLNNTPLEPEVVYIAPSTIEGRTCERTTATGNINLSTKIKALVSNGILVITPVMTRYSNNNEAGTGVSLNGAQVFPACLAKTTPGVISVGSVDINNEAEVTRYSAFSDYSSGGHVKIAAPGNHTTFHGLFGASGTNDNPYMYRFGTTQAAALVVAGAALARGWLKRHNISNTPARIEELILSSADRHSRLASKVKNGRALNLQALTQEIYEAYPAVNTGPCTQRSKTAYPSLEEQF